MCSSDLTLAKQGAAYTVDLDRHVITTTNLPQWDRFILAGSIWANASSLPFGAMGTGSFAPIKEKGRAPKWMHGPHAMNASDSAASYLLSSLGGLGLGSGLLDGSLGGLLGSLLGKLSSTLSLLGSLSLSEIGRASCRERVSSPV